MSKTIFIVDDDVHIGNLLEELLTAEGYAVRRAYSGTEALMLMEKQRPDLVLLDLMLPGLSGEELLLGGAADYVTKPFDSQELLARIAVQLRRSGAGPADAIELGGLRLEPASLGLTVNGEPVRLTRTEFAILKLLMRNPGQVIAKSAILDRISADTPDCTDASLKQHVSNLRRKLREAGAGDCIEAVWGIGFRFVD